MSILHYLHLPEQGDFHNLIFLVDNIQEQKETNTDEILQEPGEEESESEIGNNNNNNAINNNNHDPFYDKVKLLDVLRNMDVDPHSIDNSTWSQVPTWKSITEVWGKEPRIYGLEESCSKFRNEIPAHKRHIAVGGIFSTGTNLMAQLLQHNCGIPERIEWIGNRNKGHGMEWQVPWGKHNPFRYRGNHSVKEFLRDKRDPKLEDYLPVVTIRDPYDWMKSMCKHSYTLRWDHTRGDVGQECPSMVDEKTGKIRKITAKFGADSLNRIPFNNSLVGVWNTFYGEYFHKIYGDVPVLVIRFEDIIFFSKEITKTICECAGGKLLGPLSIYSDKEASVGDFHYVVGSAVVGKGHGPVDNHRNGIVDSWIKYSKPRSQQKEKFSSTDLGFIQKVIDRNMTNFFDYQVF
eukprot:CAMPEP_0194175832 /NCGR_PEP_ID=MMETSP0154-20130528/9831_1 /TAXON_ID=1049557 /ORGANISM="Thalassiothrix antarctica, Strain L6-D1" /LENGTH=404 /DNA_ID=CAMNT_0038889801 /DNA_START=188 /DNA_END=1402 /DNA_ORIENTATION=+